MASIPSGIVMEPFWNVWGRYGEDKNVPLSVLPTDGGSRTPPLPPETVCGSEVGAVACGRPSEAGQPALLASLRCLGRLARVRPPLRPAHSLRDGLTLAPGPSAPWWRLRRIVVTDAARPADG